MLEDVKNRTNRAHAHAELIVGSSAKSRDGPSSQARQLPVRFGEDAEFDHALQLTLGAFDVLRLLA